MKTVTVDKLMILILMYEKRKKHSEDFKSKTTNQKHIMYENGRISAFEIVIDSLKDLI